MYRFRRGGIAVHYSIHWATRLAWREEWSRLLCPGGHRNTAYIVNTMCPSQAYHLELPSERRAHSGNNNSHTYLSRRRGGIAQPHFQPPTRQNRITTPSLPMTCVDTGTAVSSEYNDIRTSNRKQGVSKPRSQRVGPEEDNTFD